MEAFFYPGGIALTVHKHLRSFHTRAFSLITFAQRLKSMKNLLLVLFLLAGLFASAQDIQYFGKKIDESGAISMSELMERTTDGKEMHVKVYGKVEEVCQAKGCWMLIEKGNGTTMRVKFKDYGFFVPKNCAGKTAVMEGKAFYRTVSVDELKHYAEDAGKSKEEIEAIKEPQKALAFEAEGVILKD